MIQQVSHPVTAAVDAADITLALAVAYELHEPLTATRPAEITAAPQLMGLRTTAARPHRRKVPLNRLSTMRG